MGYGDSRVLEVTNQKSKRYHRHPESRARRFVLDPILDFETRNSVESRGGKMSSKPWPVRRHLFVVSQYGSRLLVLSSI